MDDKTELNVFFDAAKDAAPKVSMDLMANILGDAADISAARIIPKTPKSHKNHWWKTLFEPFGGMQGLAAVGFSAFLGVAAGYAGADTLESVPGVGVILASINGDPIDDLGFGEATNFDTFLTEG